MVNEDRWYNKNNVIRKMTMEMNQFDTTVVWTGEPLKLYTYKI